MFLFDNQMYMWVLCSDIDVLTSTPDINNNTILSELSYTTATDSVTRLVTIYYQLSMQLNIHCLPETMSTSLWKSSWFSTKSWIQYHFIDNAQYQNIIYLPYFVHRYYHKVITVCIDNVVTEMWYYLYCEMNWPYIF